MQVHRRRRTTPGSDSLGLRAWAWLHQYELDRELAEGADPASTPGLHARAHQLLSPHFRHALVAELDAVLRKAERPPCWHSATLPVCAGEVHAARPSLESLRAALREPGVPPVQGVALAACLINDPEGPVYHRAGTGAVAQLADTARAALAARPSLPIGSQVDSAER